MKAFNNDKKLKEFYVNRMIEHAKADEVIQGETWENGKGCFIGCSFHKYDHGKFESLGLPIWLAKLAERLFEGQSNEDAKEFAVKFYPAINVGSDLDKIKLPFLAYVVESVYNGFDHKKYTEQERAIRVIVDRLKAGEVPTKEERADVAAYAVYAFADAASIASAAVDADADADVSVVYVPNAAVAAVVYIAYAAAAADVRRDKFKEFADELLRLMREEQA